jgi:hypothetical protein
MIFRIAVLSALVALFAGTALAQQGAGALIPQPDAAASTPQTDATAGLPAKAMKAGQRRKMAHGLDARERRETKALNWLEATGNRDFSDVRRDGRNYRATVTNDGTQQAVIVDPDNGRVSSAN